MPTLKTPSINLLHWSADEATAAVLDRQRVVLPVPLTPLIARETEVATARDMLLSPDVRLVTLAGPGGVGKSRVAIQTAWELADAFAGDVHLVCLATLGEPDLLLSSIAQTLGLPDPGATRPVATFAAMLAARRALLLLDNFEPVLAAGPILADLLNACPDLKALVTSRERLRLRGERVLRITPLTPPTLDEIGDVVALRLNPGVRLMVQQALEVVPDFHLTTDNATAIAQIVRRLEGLPLAIELAAARMVVFSPAELLTRLHRQLPLLSSGPSDLPDRLRTMRDAIAWSYDLLTAEERRLFRDLSIIANSFTLEAAEWMSRDGPHEPAGVLGSSFDSRQLTAEAEPVLDGVASLVDKSLLYKQTAAGEPRYAMLEIIREFGLEQLAAFGEIDAARRRHAMWWLALAERAAAVGIQHRDASLWLDRLELNDDDFRAALAWFETTGDTERFLRLVAALAWFWRFRSHRTEGRRWLQRAVEQARAADLRMPARARALAEAAILAMTQGDYTEVKSLATECLMLAQEIDHAWATAAALNLIGSLARAQGELDRAAGVFTQALTLSQRHELGECQALALLNLGTVAYWQGDRDRGIALGTEALVLFRRQEDHYGTAIALNDVALMASQAPDRTTAATLFGESLEAWRAVGTTEGLIEWLARVAMLALACRRTELGVSLLTADERACETFGYHFEPPERALQERALAAARSTVPITAFTAAVEEGRQLTLEDAIAAGTEFLTALLKQTIEETRPEKDAPYGLTPRELDVLRLLIDGRTDRQIGDALSISHRTVMRHVEHILSKLDVDSRTAAATQAVRLSLV